MEGKIKDRASTVRLRTWTLTIAILIALALYFLVQVGWNDKVNVVDLIFVAAVQIMMHCMYFPDGELFGQRNPVFLANKAAYNAKATSINEGRKIGKLRAFCTWKYEQKKEEYLAAECGGIGISLDEFAAIRQMSHKEIMRLKVFEYDGRLFHFTFRQRRHICRLIFHRCPVEPNTAETILSATDGSAFKAISDKSVSFKAREYVKKILMSIVVGSFLAYVGYTTRDGISIAVVVKIVTYIVSMFSTAVLSFSKGEQCQKVYKNQFYVDLSNFIDEFTEWEAS